MFFKMKKLALLLFVSLIGISCSIDDDNGNYYYDVLPVESFELPTSFEFGKVYIVSLKFKRPTDCYTNPSLYFEKNGKIRTIAIQSLVANRKDCEAVPNEIAQELKFNFEVLTTTPYVFKFYKGTDENGVDIYEEVTVPVNNTASSTN